MWRPAKALLSRMAASYMPGTPASHHCKGGMPLAGAQVPLGMVIHDLIFLALRGAAGRLETAAGLVIFDE